MVRARFNVSFGGVRLAPTLFFIFIFYTRSFLNTQAVPRTQTLVRRLLRRTGSGQCETYLCRSAVRRRKLLFKIRPELTWTLFLPWAYESPHRRPLFEHRVPTFDFVNESVRSVNLGFVFSFYLPRSGSDPRKSRRNYVVLEVALAHSGPKYCSLAKTG